jgi:hypothetical protein
MRIFSSMVSRSGGSPALPVTSAMALCTASGRELTKFSTPDAGGGRLGVRPAEGKQLLRDAAVLAGVKVDAEHPDELAVILDEHGGGA